MQAGSGEIVLSTAGGTVVEKFAVGSSSRVSFNGSTDLTITPTSALAYGTGYVLSFPSGAVRDTAGNAFAGLSGYDFTTVPPPDIVAPTVQSVSPTAGATAIAVGANLVITFSEAVRAGTGRIDLRKADGSLFETFDVYNSSSLQFSGNVLTIDPTKTLAYSTSYRLELAAGSVKDSAGNAFAGGTTHEFTTAAPPDKTAPSLTGGTPAPGSTGASTTADLLLQFNEPIARGSGAITLRTAAGTQIERFDAASSRVTVDGNTLRIDPSADLSGGSSYRIELSSGSIKDLSGNANNVMLSLQFTTQAPPPPRNLTGTAAADRLEGGPAADRLDGAGGNDTLIGLAGNDDLRGGDGIDTAQYSLARSAYQLTAQGAGWRVAANSGDEGSDTLTAVERLAFSDRHVALDLNGNAGAAAKLIGALLGPAAVKDVGLAGLAIALLDGGMSTTALAEGGLATDAFIGLAGGGDAQHALAQIWRNVFGTEPDLATVDLLAGQVARGEISLPAIAVIAADLPSNAIRIDLAGLAGTGLDYTPFGE